MGIYKIIFYGRNVRACKYIYIYISIGNPARESSRAWRRNILDTREDRVSFTRCGIKYRRLVYLFRYRDRFDIDLITRRRNDNLGIV